MVNNVKQSEMQGYYPINVEMYRDTTDHRNIQKKWAQCQKNMGVVINYLQNKTKTEKGKDNSRSRDLQ
jgi:hypothetical protein